MPFSGAKTREEIMKNEVRTISIGGKTVVRITEDGSISERKFDYADFANSWADGQRVRLEQAVADRRRPVQGVTGR